MAIIHKDLQFLNRPIVFGSVLIPCMVWLVYIPLKVIGVLPSHLTWFKIILAPLMLAYMLSAITVVPTLGIWLGISGRTWRFMFLFLLYFVPPFILLSTIVGISG